VTDQTNVSSLLEQYALLFDESFTPMTQYLSETFVSCGRGLYFQLSLFEVKIFKFLFCELNFDVTLCFLLAYVNIVSSRFFLHVHQNSLIFGQFASLIIINGILLLQTVRIIYKHNNPCLPVYKNGSISLSL
jgi:hypothetical protein